MRQNILLIYPPDREGVAIPDVPPLGLAYLASFARSRLGKDYPITLLDLNLIRPDEQRLRQILMALEARPNIIGIGGIVTVFKHFLSISKICKEIFPDAVLVAGGSLATTTSHLLFAHSPVDICVKGEGEETFLEILEILERGGGSGDLKNIRGTIVRDTENSTILNNPSRGQLQDLDAVGMPAYELLEMERYAKNGILNLWSYAKDLPSSVFSPGALHMSLVTSRGCTNRCTFCHRQFPQMRMHSPTFIIDHIMFLHETYGINVITFIDELFNSSTKRMDEMISCLTKIQQKIPDFRFRVGGLRADLVTPEFLHRLKDVGCFQVIYGLEFGSQKILNLMRKNITVEENRRAVIAAKDAGLHCIPQFVFGLPGEDRSTLREAIDFIKSVDFWTYLSLHRANAYPGSELYQYAKEKNLIKDEFNYISSLASTDQYPLQLGDISPQEMKNLIRRYTVTRELKKNFKVAIFTLAVKILKKAKRVSAVFKSSETQPTTLFFESYSIIQLLFLFGRIKKSKEVYFYKKSFPPSRFNPRVKKIVIKMIRLCNNKVEIRTLPAEMVNRHAWAMNKKAVDVTDKLSASIESSASYRNILNIIKDGNILKCYKAQVVNDISSRLLFFKIAEDLIAERKNGIFLIPVDNDNEFIQNELFGNKRLDSHIPSICVAANRVIKFLRKIYLVIALQAVPVTYVALMLNKLTFGKIGGRQYDISMAVTYGFYNSDIMVDGVKRLQDDSYLYDEEAKKGRIIHIFKMWKWPPQIESNYKKVMNEKGVPFIDEEDYKLNLEFMKIAARIQLSLLKFCLIHKFCWNDKVFCLIYSRNIVYWMLKTHLEFKNVDYKVGFIKYDYSPYHIVETILASQNNRKMVGIQHAASPYESPALSYVHFDKYLVYGEMFIREFSSHWSRLKLEKTGRESVDFVLSFLKDEDAMARLRDRFEKIYPARKYRAIIAMSGDVDYIPRSQWDEMYNALHSLKELNDLDINVFLRFRSTKYMTGSENMLRFSRLPQWDDRIIIDHENFSTYELMVLCDLFIACNISFTVNEAIATRAKVFTFNLHGRADYFFGDRYGKDFILNTEADLLRVFKGLKNNFQGFDCDWPLLKKECNFYYDSKNLQRIREAAWSTVL